MEKTTYYVNISAGEILMDKDVSPWQYQIEAAESEVEELRLLFDGIEENSMDDFLRAQTPFREYHDSPSNDIYDDKMKKIFEKIYQLGNEEAKEHIREIGVIE